MGEQDTLTIFDIITDCFGYCHVLQALILASELIVVSESQDQHIVLLESIVCRIVISLRLLFIGLKLFQLIV